MAFTSGYGNSSVENREISCILHQFFFMSKAAQGNQYIAAALVKKQYAISRSTLRRWAEECKIRAVRTEGKGKRLYSTADIDQLFRSNAIASARPPKEKIIYARVSSAKQHPDLERQIQDLSRRALTAHKN